MSNLIFIQLSKKELVTLLKSEVKNAIKDILTKPKIAELKSFEKPHLTRKETSEFFGVSLNCINDWCKKGILKPKKVGQRIFFLKTDLFNTLFGKEEI
ncbi:helix-turn-helix domain-containing protein [uncultured Polaribacter sp.]|uniref:helix-turn-helix domain-containing protein n=1 Tax=uncultured Polaribacter sp. TaxID=174711 RepID=UPI00261885DA|nr:helix-turn-helix domain-containing protein [uncultured Polaribacter sp.]